MDNFSHKSLQIFCTNLGENFAEIRVERCAAVRRRRRRRRGAPLAPSSPPTPPVVCAQLAKQQHLASEQILEEEEKSEKCEIEEEGAPYALGERTGGGRL